MKSQLFFIAIMSILFSTFTLSAQTYKEKFLEILYTDRGQLECFKLFTNVDEIYPGVFMITSSEKDWDSRLKLSDLRKEISSAMAAFSKEYPKSFRSISIDDIYSSGLGLVFATIGQIRKYKDELVATNRQGSCFQVYMGTNPGPLGPYVHVNVPSSFSGDTKLVGQGILEVVFHEMGHDFAGGNRDATLVAYQNSMKNSKIWNSKCKNDYMRENGSEYFAELFSIWTGYNHSYDNCLGKIKDSSDARKKLKSYDPVAYTLMANAFAKMENTASSAKAKATVISSSRLTELLTCGSVNTLRKECPLLVNGKGPISISLKKQISKIVCELDKNFGITNEGIYTDKGCVGEFQVSFSGIAKEECKPRRSFL